MATITKEQIEERVVEAVASFGPEPEDVVREATLEVPEVAPRVPGGRAGLHTEHLGRLLAEMQHLTSSHPGATW